MIQKHAEIYIDLSVFEIAMLPVSLGTIAGAAFLCALHQMKLSSKAIEEDLYDLLAVKKAVVCSTIQVQQHTRSLRQVSEAFGPYISMQSLIVSTPSSPQLQQQHAQCDYIEVKFGVVGHEEETYYVHNDILFACSPRAAAAERLRELSLGRGGRWAGGRAPALSGGLGGLPQRLRVEPRRGDERGLRVERLRVPLGVPLGVEGPGRGERGLGAHDAVGLVRPHGAVGLVRRLAGLVGPADLSDDLPDPLVSRLEMVHLGLGQQPRQQQQLLQPLQPLQHQQQQHTKQGQQQRRDGPSRKRRATPRSPSSESVRQQLGDRLYIQVMHSQTERRRKRGRTGSGGFGVTPSG